MRVYLKDARNPRWVAKPTVAYLWARTVRCKGCRATIPLLKTCWLAKKGAKRVLLTMTPDAERTGVVFGVDADVPPGEGNPAQRREHDRRTGGGTMSRSGAQCPLCQAIMTMQDLRLDGRAGRLGAVLTAVVVDGPHGKEYRLPTALELQAARVEQADLDTLYAGIPFGPPDEPTPKAGVGASRAFSVRRLRLRHVAHPLHEPPASGPRHLRPGDTPPGRDDGRLAGSVARGGDRDADADAQPPRRSRQLAATWTNSPEQIRNTFARFALRMMWDFVEACPLADTTGGFIQAVEWTAEACEHLLAATPDAPAPTVRRRSAAAAPAAADGDASFDLICTDPPYYDAIPYSDLMDFFHVWLRRALWGLSLAIGRGFRDAARPEVERRGQRRRADRRRGALRRRPGSVQAKLRGWDGAGVLAFPLGATATTAGW